MTINPRNLAEAIQKAKFQGKTAADALKKAQAKEDASKKDQTPAVAPNAGEGEAISQNFVQKAKSFAQSMASRGVKNNKASPDTISLRVLSCHGNDELGLPACPKRMDSAKYTGSYYCGACGCGDKQLTQLTSFNDNGKLVEYTKLHYPKVTCPLQMPGFTNYQSCAENNKTANDRKMFIEFREGVDSIKAKSNP